MFGLLKKKIDVNAWVAVCSTEDTVTVARIRRSKDSPPTLELCEVQKVENIGIQGAEISRLTKLHHLDEHYCVSLLDIGDYNLLLVEAPDVLPAELRAAIRWRVKDLIDFHLDEAVIDVFEVPNQRQRGSNNSMMYAVVARSGQVKQRIDLLKASGLNIEVIDIPELALRNIAALLAEDVAGVVTLCLSQRDGLITITRQSTLYLSRRIAIGSMELGNDMAAAGSRLDRIVVEIQRSLDYYESHFSQPAITNIMITPLPQHIQGMDEYLAEQLGINVRFIELDALIDSDESVDLSHPSGCLMAIGAALRQDSKEL